MMRFKLPSPAMGVAVVALFVALGGTGYAAGEISSNAIARNPVHGKLSIAALIKQDVAAYLRAHASQFKGAAGRAGQPGANGQPGVNGQAGANGQDGAPGTAFAYAHVSLTGVVDAANSKNVTLLAHPTSGVYCLQVAGTPHNVVATPMVPGLGFIVDTQGTPYVEMIPALGCPAATNVSVIMWALNGAATTDWPFFISVN